MPDQTNHNLTIAIFDSERIIADGLVFTVRSNNLEKGRNDKAVSVRGIHELADVKADVYFVRCCSCNSKDEVGKLAERYPEATLCALESGCMAERVPACPYKHVLQKPFDDVAFLEMVEEIRRKRYG